MSAGKKAGASTLSKAAINLNALREDGREELVQILDRLHGNKCLVLDPNLSGPLNHVLSSGSQVHAFVAPAVVVIPCFARFLDSTMSEILES